jgi:ribosomal protein S18 acetylase RimI-like enzyme
VFEFASGRGVIDVAAWVVEDNDRAMRFYRKHGFRPDGTRQTFDPEPDKDELLIVRTL